jgi:hypothetical protein
MNRPNFLVWSLNGIVPFEWPFFGQNNYATKEKIVQAGNSTNEISYGTIASAQSALMAVDRCRDGHRSGELLTEISLVELRHASFTTVSCQNRPFEW